jgi:ATP-dependent RNA helicase
MADRAGIDRKADEKIQFSTSKEVTVHPTFESMSLKGASLPTSHCLSADIAC